MNIEIANRLVNLRKTNNLSQEALAEKLGISRQAVSKWERAEGSPDTDNLILLARLYGISLDELLKTEDEIPMPEAVSEVSVEALAENVNVESRLEHMERESWEGADWYSGWRRLGLRHFPLWAVICVLYIVAGAVWNAWHPGWLLFLFAPIWHSLVEAVEKKNPNYFAYPVLATLVFLCLGFFWGLWHPGWVVFMTIPLYYSLVSWYKGEKMEDQDDEK